MNITQWKMESPIGTLYLVASEKGLQGVFWKEQATPIATSLDIEGEDIRILSQAVREIEEYLTGKRQVFTIPTDIKGTPFQKKVWEELKRIPYGTTKSYRDIARTISSEKAVRAVGTANGKNPLCIVVPCHRVITSNGSLGGYLGGLMTKGKLLEMERNVGEAEH